MAEHLASIFGTEKDRVNCPFYFKIGYAAQVDCPSNTASQKSQAPHLQVWAHKAMNRRACRHGDRCSRLHNKPTISQTLLLQNMYQNPALNAPPGPDGLPMPIDARQSQEHFEVIMFSTPGVLPGFCECQITY